MSAGRKKLFASTPPPNPFGASAFARETHQPVTFADAVRRTRWIAVDIDADRFSLFLLAQPGMRRGLLPCFDSDYPVVSAETRLIAGHLGDRLADRVIGSTMPVWWSNAAGETASLAGLEWARRMPAPASVGMTAVAFPVFSERGPSGLVVFTGPSIAIEPETLFDVHARCFVLFESVTRIAAEEKSGAPAISRRELECLRLAADGHTSEEIGGLLDLSVHTTNQYLTSTTQKLGAMNRMHAVAKALRLGLIE